MNRTIANVIREREQAPTPTMPRPGRVATWVDVPPYPVVDAVRIAAGSHVFSSDRHHLVCSDGRRWLAVTSHDGSIHCGFAGEVWTRRTAAEADALAKALLGLGWTEVRHG